jgi:serine/threonine-protein kinase OSR1/STK39
MVRELAALFSLLHQMKPQAQEKDVVGEVAAEGTLCVSPSAIARGRDHIVDFFDAFRCESFANTMLSIIFTKNLSAMRSNLEDGGVALMMEYMNGGSLQDIVNDGGCQDEGTLASIALQVLTGLDFLHRCNQIHRDIKPANILINSEGIVKVSDLGILKQLDPNAAAVNAKVSSGGAGLPDLMDGSSDASAKGQLSTILEQPDRAASQEMAGSSSLGSRTLDLDEREIFRANTFVGTLTYMAPERIDGRSYTFNSDVWSFGLTLLAVAQGKLPIDQSNGFWSILNCVRDLPPPSLPKDGTWSEACVDFISQCLIQRPAKRPSCSELLQHPFL